MRPRPAAPPGAWVGLAAEPAEAGGRPPIDGPLLRGPVGGLDGRVAARAAPRERGLRTSGASGRPPMPGFANPPPNPDPPRFRRRLLRRLRAAVFPGPPRPLRARRGRGGQAPNASPPCCGLPRCARTGPARPPRARRRRAHPDFTMPMSGEGALSIRALEWADESGRTRKGRRPAPTPPNETNRLQGRRARASRPAATPKNNRAPRAFFSVPGSKKEGPAVSGGPLGDPWWSLGGSNP